MPMTDASASHLVLIPSYNPDHKVDNTARNARAQQDPVWVVMDGNIDGSTERLQAITAQDPGLRVIVLPCNRDKGVTILADLEAAVAAGFTYVLAMDADGQHPVNLIPEFMVASQVAPGAMILSRSVFDATTS